MSTAARLGAYAAALVVVFGAATGVGAALGPDAAGAGSEHVPAQDPAGAAGAAGARTPTAAAAGPPGGLAVSQDGYTLALAQGSAAAGAAVATSFRVLGPDGAPVTAYETSHDEDLHLVAVRRDLAGFQHVHPDLGADGTWTVPLGLTPGAWRLIADFTPAGGDALVLGADLAVAGDHAPQPLPEPAATSEVDGYTVALDGRLVPGQETELTLTVTKDGQPVSDLQPYLAAYGHLVALRAGDLAHTHVHPAGAPGDGATQPGPDVTFHATAPSVGDYRLFLDFRHGGVVRTAAFTVRADGAPAPAEAARTEDGHTDDGHGR